MVMKKAEQNDALLALISTLTVVFIVLFISLAYFMNFRTVVARQEVQANALFEEMVGLNNTRVSEPSVAGYETEYPF